MRRIFFFAFVVLVMMPVIAESGIRAVPKSSSVDRSDEGRCIIKGYGTDSHTAVADAIKQIHQVFGSHRIVSESVVRKGVLKKDEVHEDTDLSVSRLDRFYRGVRWDGKRFVAVFSFPREGLIDLMADSQSGLDKHRKAKKKAGWKIPESVLRFIDFYVWDIR